MIEINGTKVERGDIIVLMASPDAGSVDNPTETACVVTYHPWTKVTDIVSLPYLVLGALLSTEERADLLEAIGARRRELETANAVGIFALIWSREAYQQKLRERSPAPEAPASVHPLDFLDAINFGRGPDAGRLAANGVMIYPQTWINLDKAAERLADLMTKRRLNQ